MLPESKSNLSDSYSFMTILFRFRTHSVSKSVKVFCFVKMGPLQYTKKILLNKKFTKLHLVHLFSGISTNEFETSVYNRKHFPF